METRVRYAPSPTGLQHIGGVRTALFNYFFAKSSGGKFILRVEDTDRTRYSDEALEDLYSTLDWLGIKWDEGPIAGGPYGPYIQSERYDIYRKYAQQLVDSGMAYYCFCTPERLEALRSEQEASHSPEQGYDRHCRNLSKDEVQALLDQGLKPVIRLKVPTEGSTTFHDVIMGDITRENKDISPDPILLKSDGFPTYHLANVIDDHLMHITHILRAQEWIPSGPLHVILYKAFGWEPPVYCHLPMVMGSDGHKLSKRHGSTSVRDFRDKGYLPEAIINYVTLVGWSFDGEKQFFSKAELEKDFSIEKINKAPGVFDYKKLDWFNGQYIRAKSDSELAALLVPYLDKESLLDGMDEQAKLDRVTAIVPLVKERLVVLSDVNDMTRFVFRDPGMPDAKTLCAKGHTAAQEYQGLAKAYPILRSGLESGKPDSEIEQELCAIAPELGIKVNGVFMPIRASVTGSQVSPPLFDSIRAVGYDESFRRIERALEVLKAC
ncbi:MAG: glutamate--tRNA ligase [Sphaerochaetaceae bacterium]|nr:glutamate--tRNA ligase [Sphaerochaetaceae bacterium]MDD4397393.1 glutamate--tRNA ligase [Sphaerochaetaceae bacterium]